MEQDTRDNPHSRLVWTMDSSCCPSEHDDAVYIEEVCCNIIMVCPSYSYVNEEVLSPDEFNPVRRLMFAH